MDQVDLEKQSETIQELQEWAKNILPKEKTYPFLYFNWDMMRTKIEKVCCSRCKCTIWKDDPSFCLVKMPEGSFADKFEYWCIDCATDEEKELPNFKSFDPSKRNNKRMTVYNAIVDHPGISENQLLERCEIGLPRLKVIVESLVSEHKIQVVRGAKATKMHFITTKEKYLN